ncbi:hypothetical protein pb186bvf_017489 [Paramecium bursaria]
MNQFSYSNWPSVNQIGEHNLVLQSDAQFNCPNKNSPPIESTLVQQVTLGPKQKLLPIAYPIYPKNDPSQSSIKILIQPVHQNEPQPPSQPNKDGSGVLKLYKSPSQLQFQQIVLVRYNQGEASAA